MAALAWVYGAQVAADAHLSAPAPTALVYDRSGRFLTRVGLESAGGV